MYIETRILYASLQLQILVLFCFVRVADRLIYYRKSFGGFTIYNT